MGGKGSCWRRNLRTNREHPMYMVMQGGDAERGGGKTKGQQLQGPQRKEREEWIATETERESNKVRQERRSVLNSNRRLSETKMSRNGIPSWEEGDCEDEKNSTRPG